MSWRSGRQSEIGVSGCEWCALTISAASRPADAGTVAQSLDSLCLPSDLLLKSLSSEKLASSCSDGL
jgi:hypothetical protein